MRRDEVVVTLRRDGVRWGLESQKHVARVRTQA
jgi:hypothetical protein